MTAQVSIDSGRNINNVFEQYLLSREKVAIKAIHQFEEKLHHSHFKFGRFTIPTFYKPQFITRKQHKLIQSASNMVARISDRLTSLFPTEPVLKHTFQLTPEELELVSIDPGYSKTIVMARFDCFLEGERLQFMQFNCDAPGGMAYTDLVEQLYFEQADMADFFHEFHFDRIMRSERLLAALLSAYEEFGGYETPKIAIVDWKNVRTRPECEILKTIFEEKGYKTVIADPRDLKFRAGKLYHGDFRIDLVYRRIVLREILDKLDEISDFIKAYKEHAVCVVNPLRSYLGSSKALLSILTNPEFDHFFSEKENLIKKDHIPWTRRVLDAERFYGGKKIYLVDFLKDEKDSLVLKPSESYGGAGVTIGRETRDDDWNAAIDKALKSNWVIQECLEAPVTNVPSVVNNKLEFVLKRINTGCFVFDGNYAGSFARLGDDSVINVSRGGGLVPTIGAEGEITR